MTDIFFAFASRRRPPHNRLLRPEVGADGGRLRTLLATVTPDALSRDQVQAEVNGNLWMLGPDAFRYFLPAFLMLAVQHYDRLGYFVAELIGALTEPTRDDIIQALDRAAQIPASIGLSPDTQRQLRQQQLEWFDSGTPLAIYRERMADLSDAERDAITGVLATLRDTHPGDFPFNEPQTAIDRLNRFVS